MNGNAEGLEELQQQMWNWFRNIASLARGAAEHAAEAERAACFATVPGIVGPRIGEDRAAMRRVALGHADRAMQFAIAVGACLVCLKELADKAGGEQESGHLRNAKFHVEKAIQAEQCAKEAIEAMESRLADKNAKFPVCQMAML